jgi:hypothetical protein
LRLIAASNEQLNLSFDLGHSDVLDHQALLFDIGTA